MKTATIQRLMKRHLLPEFPELDYSGRLLYVAPLDDVLRGFYFDDSAFSRTTVFVEVVVLPLYVPYEHVHFTFGYRLTHQADARKVESWDISEPVNRREVETMKAAMRDNGLPYLLKLATPLLIAENLIGATKLRDNPVVHQAVAFSLARVGRYPESQERLAALIRQIEDPRWHRILETSTQLLRAIDNGAASAIALLERWKGETARTLGLRLAA
jgi:hypothetical protein